MYAASEGGGVLDFANKNSDVSMAHTAIAVLRRSPSVASSHRANRCSASNNRSATRLSITPPVLCGPHDSSTIAATNTARPRSSLPSHDPLPSASLCPLLYPL